MIVTKIPNEDNTALFERAERDYEKKYGKEININTFDDYFLYINDLAEISDYYLRVPLDEPLLYIDANTREIKTKGTPFEKNGISIKGDVISEIIFFEIDRYYDITDLARDDVNIIIQWKNTSSKKNPAPQGSLKAIIKIVDADRGKIIFGWPIDEEITEEEGNIEFSVRFYTLIDGELEYSFSTLPATLKVKPTLSYNITDISEIIDKSDFIKRRLRNSSINNLPESIEISKPILWLVIPGKENYDVDKNQYEMDLDENGQATFLATAYAVDGIDFVYNWRKDSVLISSNHSDDQYLPVEMGSFYQEKIHYYKKSYDENDENLYNYINVNPGTEVTDDDIYTKNNRYIATKAGEYKVGCYQKKTIDRVIIDAEGNISTDTSEVGSEETILSSTIIIPGPEPAVIQEGLKYTGYIAEDGATVELSIFAAAADKNALSYQWFYKDGDSEIDIEDANESYYDASSEHEYYGVRITTARNKEEEQVTSENFRVTLPASTPSVSAKEDMIYLSQTNNLVTIDNFDIIYGNQSEENYSYQWIEIIKEGTTIETEFSSENISYQPSSAGTTVCLRVRNIYNEDIADSESASVIVMQ